MTRASVSRTGSRPGRPSMSIGHAWAALHAHFEERSKALSAEVRSYPTPIARCDEQLTKLIEQRDNALQRLNLVRQISSASNLGAKSLAPIWEFVDKHWSNSDDPQESDLLRRLRAALVEAGANE